MVDFYIDKFWNRGKDIYNEVPGSYSLLLGFAETGPSILPVYIKDMDYAANVFGTDSLLTTEIEEFFENGGSNLWAVKLNGCHYEYNIQNKLKISTTIATDFDTTFSYRIWENEYSRYLTIYIEFEEFVYDINNKSIESLCQEISAQTLADRGKIYANYIQNGSLEIEESEIEKRYIKTQGMETTNTEEVLTVYYDTLEELFSKISPNIIGFSGVSFETERNSRWEFIRRFSQTLIENSTGFSGTTSSIGVVPFIGHPEELLAETNMFYDRISNNTEEENFHNENLLFTSSNLIQSLRYAPIQDFVIYKVIREAEDNVIIEPFDIEGVCTISLEYGIIEVIDQTVLPLELRIEYNVSKIPLYNLLCLVYDNISEEDEILLSSGVGAFMGQVIGAGLNGSIRFVPIKHVREGTSIIPSQEIYSQLKRNGVIYTRPIALGGHTYLGYVTDKTLYHILEKNGITTELCNVNLIRSIQQAFLNGFNEFHEENFIFKKDTISKPELIIESIMETFSPYINRYDYKINIAEDPAYFQKNLNIDVDLYIDGKLEKIQVGYVL